MKKIAAAKNSNSEQIKLALERLDEVATGYEKKWDVDRLIRLVDQGLAERFSEQLDLLNLALERHVALDVISHADALARGWAELDAAAESQGSPQIGAMAWDVITPAGRKIAFVSDIRAYRRLNRGGWKIWSAKEVGNIIGKFHVETDWDASEAMRQTKKLFPGAEITGLRPKVMLDDAIPF